MTQENYSSNNSSVGIKALVYTTFVLLLCTLIGGAIGWGSSYLKTPQWRTTAKFETPSISNLGNYYSLFSTYDFLKGDNHTSYVLLKNEEENFTLVPQKTQTSEDNVKTEVYDTFKQNLTSEDLLNKFLKSNSTIKLIAQANNQDLDTTAKQIATRFSFRAGAKDIADSLSLTLESPQQAKVLLTQFINFANKQTRIDLNKELIVKWKVLFKQVQSAVDNKLGATKQEGKVAKEDWEGKLKLMKTVKPLDDKLVAFNVVQTPDVPSSPVSPNKLLWAMIGGVAGLLVGCFIALAMTFKRRRNENKN